MKRNMLLKGLTLLMVLFIFIFSTGYDAFADNKRIDSELNYKVEKLGHSFLLEEMDKEIQDLLKLIEEIEEKKKLLKKLKRVQKYVNMDITSDLEKVKEIAGNTPLDFETSAIVVSYAERLGIKPSLILAVIKLESNFNKWEVGKHQDRGYMQIIPETEKWLANKYGHIIGLNYDPDSIFKPEYNIGLGTIYLSILSKSYGNNYHRILSEYNRGPYNLEMYYNKNRTYSTAYSRGVLSREKRFLQFNENKTK